MTLRIRCLPLLAVPWGLFTRDFHCSDLALRRMLRAEPTFHQSGHGPSNVPGPPVAQRQAGGDWPRDDGICLSDVFLICSEQVFICNEQVRAMQILYP